MTETWNYEELVEEFEESLLTRLRGHGIDSEYLELWVPDDDPVKSILNMVEAVEASGGTNIVLSVSQETLTEQQIETLSSGLTAMAKFLVERQSARFLLKITDIGAKY